MIRELTLIGTIVSAGLVWSASQVNSQSYPTQPIRIVVSSSPGGPNDTVARLASQILSKLGQPAVVENRAGAGGALAAREVAAAKPDGYTLMVGNTSTMAVIPEMQTKPGYDSLNDFAPIARFWESYQLLVVHSSSSWKTAKDLIAAAKAEPGKYSYGGSGIGTSPTLAMELLKQRTGIDIVLVAYRGASAAAADVIAGHLPMSVANIDSLMAQVQAGKLKAIATTGAARAPGLPNVPTLAEAGFPDLVVTSWSLWAVPTGTPAAIKDKLRIGTDKALKAPDVVESMKQGGFEPGTLSIAEADAFIRAEHKRWGEVIRAAGIKPQ
jgi:tripartite-type tricarboxylate transporter receptor subunit TctC